MTSDKDTSGFGGRKIRNYRRPHDQWFYHPALRDGRFSRWDVPAMLQDNAVAIGLATLYAPLAGAKFEVRANNRDLKTFIENTIHRFWSHDMPKVASAHTMYGTAIGEVLYEHNDEGLWKYAGLDDFNLNDVQALRRGRNLSGARVSNMGLATAQPIMPVPNTEGNEWNVIRPPKLFWAAHDLMYGRIYGRSILEAAWQPWMEKVGSHGAISIRRLWAFGNAFRGCWIQYPPGMTMIDGVSVDNQDVARQIAESASTGGVGALPSLVIDGVEQWKIIDPKMNGEIRSLIEYPESLDKAIWQGMGVLPEVISAPDTGGSWSGRSGPLLIFLNACDRRVRELMTAFDVGPSGYTTRNEQSGGIIRPLVIENFGPKARYEIRCISLVPKPQEPGAGGSPENAPMGKPPGPQGMGGSPGAPVGKPTNLSAVEVPDEDVAEILDLSTDSSGHEHKGSGPGGGQFTSGGGGGDSGGNSGSGQTHKQTKYSQEKAAFDLREKNRMARRKRLSTIALYAEKLSIGDANALASHLTKVGIPEKTVLRIMTKKQHGDAEYAKNVERANKIGAKLGAIREKWQKWANANPQPKVPDLPEGATSKQESDYEVLQAAYDSWQDKNGAFSDKHDELESDYEEAVEKANERTGLAAVEKLIEDAVVDADDDIDREEEKDIEPDEPDEPDEDETQVRESNAVDLSADASGPAHKPAGSPDGGQFTSGPGGGDPEPAKPKHGARAAASHAKYHELIAAAKKARIDAFNEVKADAEKEKEAASESHAQALKAIGNVGTPDEGEYTDLYGELEELLGEEYEKPSDQFEHLKEIETKAKEMLAADVPVHSNPEARRAYDEFEQKYIATYVTSDKLNADFKSAKDAGDKEAMAKNEAAWQEMLGERKKIESAKKEIADDAMEDALLPEQIAENKKHLKAIIAHARQARQHLKAYVQHRKEMQAIKAGEDMDVQLSMLSPDEVDWATVDLSTDASGHEHKGKGVGGGQFTSSGGGDEPTSSSGKAAATAKDVYHYLHEKGAAGFKKLPSGVQTAVSSALAVAFAGWTASQKLAEHVAKEKGATPEEAAKLRSIMAAWDVVAFKPTAIATAPLGPGIAAATWIVPPITGVYLAYSAATSPLATARAARNLVEELAAGAKKFVDEHTQELSTMNGGDAHRMLADAVEKHGYQDWYVALLNEAMRKTGDASAAIGLADKAIAQQPEDQSQSADDDASELFKK